MIDPSRTPALSNALNQLRSSLQTGVWREGERLPSTADLAARTGVGTRTMTRAVALLKAQGLIVGRRGGGLRVAGTPLPKQVAPKPLKLWQIKRTELERDILGGVYATGTLPGLKQLQQRYALSFRTMRKVLRSMVADRALCMQGKSYALPDRKSHVSLNRVLFIMHEFPTPPRSALNPAERRVIGAFELESLKRDITFEIMEIDFGDERACIRAAATITRRRDLLGCVLDIWWQPALTSGYIEHLCKLADRKWPIAILDEYGDFDLDLRYKANPLIQVFQIESAGAGAKIARHLMNLGHRKVAWFTPAPAARWSQLRSGGIRDQFSKAGFENALEFFAVSEGVNTLAIAYAFSGFDDALIKKAVAVGRTPERAASLFNDVKKVQAGHARRRFAKSNLERLRTFFAPLGGALSKGVPDDKAIIVISAAAMDWALRIVEEILAAPVFAAALARKDITAWVFASEITALLALPYLKARGINIPAELSVVSFDNLPGETLDWRLTSFDFNAAGFAYRMLEFITRPPRQRGAYRHVPIEVEGNIIVRGTTEKARRAVLKQ